MYPHQNHSNQPNHMNMGFGIIPNQPHTSHGSALNNQHQQYHMANGVSTPAAPHITYGHQHNNHKMYPSSPGMVGPMFGGGMQGVNGGMQAVNGMQGVHGGIAGGTHCGMQGMQGSTHVGGQAYGVAVANALRTENNKLRKQDKIKNNKIASMNKLIRSKNKVINELMAEKQKDKEKINSLRNKLSVLEDQSLKKDAAEIFSEIDDDKEAEIELAAKWSAEAAADAAAEVAGESIFDPKDFIDSNHCKKEKAPVSVTGMKKSDKKAQETGNITIKQEPKFVFNSQPVKTKKRTIKIIKNKFNKKIKNADGTTKYIDTNGKTTATKPKSNKIGKGKGADKTKKDSKSKTLPPGAQLGVHFILDTNGNIQVL